MRMRLLPGMAALCLVLAILPVRAADPIPAAPGIVVRLKSIDGLIEDGKYFAELGGKADEFKMYEGLLKGLVGKEGFQGIDTKKPIGAYGSIGAQGINSKLVVLVPIADEKAFLDFLKGKDIAREKQPDDSYKVDVPGSPVGAAYLRFVNKYAYATLGEANRDAIDPNKLLDPAKVLAGKPTSVLSVTVGIDKIPDDLKKTAIGESANALAGLKDMKEPNETDAQHQLKIALIDEMADWIKMVLNDAGEQTFSFDIDRQKADLSLSLALTAKPSTKLAKCFADLAGAKSVGAGLVGKGSAMNVVLHMLLSERLQKALGPVIDEGVNKSIEEEKDQDKRAGLQKAYKVFAPTLKSGELDLGMNFRGPSANGKYGAVLTLKVKDGSAIDKLIRDEIPKLPEKEQKNITLDVAKTGSVGIHKVEGADLDKDAREMFGTGPIYMALRNDALMVALGEGALEALKGALGGTPVPSKTLQFEMSVARMAKMMAKDQPNAEAVAKKVFAQNSDGDKVTIALEGGQSLKLTFNVKAMLVTFFSQLAQGDKKID